MICDVENRKYITSLKDFIDTRAALVAATLMLGNKRMPIEQTKAIEKTEYDLLKNNNELLDCHIRSR